MESIIIQWSSRDRPSEIVDLSGLGCQYMTLRARSFSEPASALPRYRQTGIWAVRGERLESNTPVPV